MLNHGKNSYPLVNPLILCPVVSHGPQLSSQYYPPYLTALVLAHSALNPSGTGYSPFLPQISMYGPIALSLSSLNRVALSVCHVPSGVFVCHMPSLLCQTPRPPSVIRLSYTTSLNTSPNLQYLRLFFFLCRSNRLQFHSRNPCHATRTCLV